MALLQALSAQVTLQLVEPRQSIGVSQPPAGQVILQAIPIGQVMGPVQGEQPEPQAKVQTPFKQAPPDATQSAQATSASGGPQDEVVPASVRPAPPLPTPAVPGIPPPPMMLNPPLPVTPPVPRAPPAPGAPPAASPPAPDGSPAASGPSPPSPPAGSLPAPPAPGSVWPPLPLPLPLPPVDDRPPAPLSTGAPAPPDAAATAESPDRSNRHPTPRSGTRTEMNNAENRGPFFKFLRSFERAPARQGTVSCYKEPLSMTMANLTHCGTWLPTGVELLPP